MTPLYFASPAEWRKWLTRHHRVEPELWVGFHKRETATLRKRDAATFKRNVAAWKYFSSRPPWYRRVASFWVVGAKLEATRQRRLGQLIACSAAGQPIGPLKRP